MHPLTVLIVHNYYRHRGGEDAVVQHEVAALRKAGVAVQELYFHNPSEKKDPLKFFKFLSGLVYNCKAYLQVYRTVKRHRIQVVHVHNSFYQASPSVLWAARHAGARVVATVHNYRLFCLNALFFRDGADCTACADQQTFKPGIRHRCFQQSRIKSMLLAASLNLHRWLGSWKNAVDQFIIINPLMQAFLVRQGIDAGKIYFKPNFVADIVYSGYEARGSHYLAACRLEPEKGIAGLLQGWQNIDAQLHIAGTGSLTDLVRLSANGPITYLGLLSPQQMKAERDSCRALVFTSHWKEGMPLSILEAMASGLICIAQDSVATRQLIQDGVTGFLYQQGVAGAELSDKVAAVEQLTLEQRNALSVAARKYYETHFSILPHLQHLSEVYQIKLALPYSTERSASGT
jgi:glycosyltransferase involved in cell wall biosynthesis